MQIDTMSQSEFNNLTIQVETPEGKMFVSIIENEGKPIAIDVKIGKAGLALTAWAHVFGRVLTLAIEHGCTIEEIITELSSQTSERSRVDVRGVKVSSGPEGVWHALMQYRAAKFQETREALGISDDEDAARRGRESRMTR